MKRIEPKSIWRSFANPKIAWLLILLCRIAIVIENIMYAKVTPEQKKAVTSLV